VRLVSDPLQSVAGDRFPKGYMSSDLRRALWDRAYPMRQTGRTCEAALC
jgi:hypothetical protein